MKLAGHDFPPFHDRCVTEEGGEKCNKLILDLMSVTKEDIGKIGIAHYGQLTEFEFNQIEEYRQRLIAALKT